MTQKNIFAQIIDGSLPAEKHYEDEYCIVIADKFPQAPIHMLVIPKKPLPKLTDATKEDQILLGHLMLIAKKTAQELGIDDAFRLVINNGANAGQTIFHLHVHILGGQSLTETQL